MATSHLTTLFIGIRNQRNQGYSKSDNNKG